MVQFSELALLRQLNLIWTSASSVINAERLIWTSSAVLLAVSSSTTYGVTLLLASTRKYSPVSSPTFAIVKLRLA